MKVEVKFFTSLRDITGKKVEQINLENFTTVDQLIKLLSEEYGRKFGEYVYTKHGRVQPFLSFLINGKNINNMQGLDTKLQDGDIIALIPPVGGG